MTQEHFDVVVIGSGLSGISAGYHLQNYCPGKSYVILENRDAIGGTWDLFRYPGIRSDSDMYTFGYSFYPWKSSTAIADGESIRTYIRETAATYGIDQHIRFRHRVTSASWSSETSLWTIETERGDDKVLVRFTCNFLLACTGYYDYAAGYTPEFAGIDKFRGRLIHPQQWPEGLDYAGKHVVVIGSGATAITIVPAIAETAAQVTLLQRSPSYVMSRPKEDSIAKGLRRYLPARLVHGLARWYNVLFSLFFYNLSRRKPKVVKQWIANQIRQQLGADYDIKTHFTPRYNPWDQRLCITPDADLFRTIKTGKAEIVTDQIDTFTEAGVRLRSGRELNADIIVTATGLNLQVLGGIDLAIDGKPVNFAEEMSFKGTMLSNVPNFVGIVGYVNTSWTLKSELACFFATRMINYMDRHSYAVCTPIQCDPSITTAPAIEMSSGYFQRAVDKLPRQGSKKPWQICQNYVRDLINLRYAPINNKALKFSRRNETKTTA